MKRIFVDTDLGSDCDDGGALALLHALAGLGLCDIIGITYCISCESDPAAIDAINRYYGRQDIPIGSLQMGGYPANSKHPFTDVIKEEYKNSYPDRSFCDDATDVFRRVLSEQPDKSVTLIAIGPATNLKLFLESKPDCFSSLDGKALFSQKVENVCIMGGNFTVNDGKRIPEFNIESDSEAARTFFDMCESDIFMLPFEMAYDILTGKKLFECFGNENPVRRCYEVYCGGPRSSWDPCTVLFSVMPQLPCWSLSERGDLSIDVANITNFTENINGKTRIVSANDKQYIVDVIEKLFALKPEFVENSYSEKIFREEALNEC